MQVYQKRSVLYVGDAILTAFSLYVAFALLCQNAALPPAAEHLYLVSLAPLLVFRLLTQQIMGVYRIASRHAGVRDVVRIALSVAVGSALFAGYVHLLPTWSFPIPIVIIDWFIALFLIGGFRLAYRVFLVENLASFRSHATRPLRRILIVGAGARGTSLAREIRRRHANGMKLIGYLDDDPVKQHLLIDGTPVLGTTSELREIVLSRDVDDVLIAMASATGERIRDIIAQCEELPIRLRISPGFAELDDDEPLRTLRAVSVEDLLRRDPVSVDCKEIAAYLTGERVMITGAGGSIGSELVRQIIRAHPAQLLLLGHGENAVFEIEQELRHVHGITPTCLIADIRDYNRLLRLFEQHHPTVVFHAAAHKHVPLMEANVEEAITNNVLGTRNLAQAATMTGVKRFVMISTDKAVNPTSVMGATKRIAELVVQSESARGKTEFATVRFGNVLGSRGSVVPLMRGQIERGGPVTVTHPDVVRYFMTISEAAQLVVQAGAMGGRSRTYMLDMGEPVRIMDLARDLIRLSGLVPDKDIAIEVTGLRPGEKLYEELLTAEEGATVTRHQRIFAAAHAPITLPDFDQQVDDLIAAAQAGRRNELFTVLKRLAPTYRGYQPIPPIVDHAAVAVGQATAKG